ncbi:CDP-alcohol phosphatidyltransferase family protein [Fervidicoccus fontis]|uniref:CDP-diacylglycerol--serine O-phosphatidyltransferase n=1 Tax=Fervidicoccus fontis TaxID=683846 RepID=A0A7C2VC38_9CREN|nr:CDP-alcohol phosphatidyltransferase family protein [Fervidicoccus fontis]PMB76857.1 MAG: hypothetical protein C0177_04985 [Fervidicoccus fontis]HEW63628.1 hypothetical protein [Fervidicoccus fontis]
MINRKDLPNLVTVINGLVGSFALLLAIRGETELSIRLIFLSLSLDVLDGLLARKLNAMSESGELLDRVFDRVYQVIAPSIIYCYMQNWNVGSMFYSASIITLSFWRIIRRTPSKEYFLGLPLFVHTFVILSSYLSGIALPYYLMLVLVIASLFPIKYFRRIRNLSPNETKGTFWQIRIIVPLFLSIIPYSKLEILFELLFYIFIIYALFGWIPLLRNKNFFLREK